MGSGSDGLDWAVAQYNRVIGALSGPSLPTPQRALDIVTALAPPAGLDERVAVRLWNSPGWREQLMGSWWSVWFDWTDTPTHVKPLLSVRSASHADDTHLLALCVNGSPEARRILSKYHRACRRAGYRPSQSALALALLDGRPTHPEEPLALMYASVLEARRGRKQPNRFF